MIKLTHGPSLGAGAPSLLADANRLRRAAEAGKAGLWEWHLAEDVVHLNLKQVETLGLEPPALQIASGRFFKLVHPDDAALLRVEVAEAERSDREFSYEFRIHREDNGELRWLCSQGTVVERDETGRAKVMAGLCFDVTERRFAQEARELLSRELSHRMKNVLSVVSSLVAMTGEHRPEARNFVASFQARLNSLAAAHDLLIQTDWHPVALDSLVEKALTAIGVRNRIDLGTSGLVLGSHDIQTVALVLHELATNAIKHGALSNGAGRVKLCFTLADTNGAAGVPLLLMSWEETGGPHVTPPDAKGFGITLIERLTRRREPVEPVFDWRPQGLRCWFSLRLSPASRPSESA